MPSVSISEQKVWVGDTPIPLISGEIHYWRLDPSQWEPVLERTREMGLQTVATYVCWDYHELAPGQFDFRGETSPRRNLTGFLEQIAQAGLWVILRPGPYIYSEWKNGGVPDRAARLHRMDPAFQDMARVYMQAVVEETLPYLASRGGPVILWQPENEIDPWPHLYTEQLGLGTQPGSFQQFLQEMYQDVEHMNTAWGTHFPTFEAARAVCDKFPSNPDRMRRYSDTISFKHWYVSQVARWTSAEYRRLGVDVPFVVNTYSGHATQPWAELEEIAGLSGQDIYPSQEFRLRTNEHRNFLDTVRYAASYSKLPYIAEFQAGIWHEWLQDVGTFTANHYRLMGISALLAGAAGWNWYMLVNRDNWYQAPINEWGRIRPDLFEAFSQIVSLFKRVDPTTLDRQVEVAISFDPLQRGVEGANQKLIESFYQADIDYTYFDLRQGRTQKPVLFYGGGDSLDRAGQEKLLEYVEAGGHLVCLGAYPHRDEHWQPLNLLGIQEPAGITSGQPFGLDLQVFGRYPVLSPWVYNYEQTPGDSLVVERLPVSQRPAEELSLQFSLQVGARYTAGYTLPRGMGKLTVIGLEPSPALVLDIHDHFKIPFPVRSTTPGVSTALFRRDEEVFIFAANAGDEGKTAHLLLDSQSMPAGEWQVEDLMSGVSRTASVGPAPWIDISLARRDGKVLRISHLID